MSPFFLIELYVFFLFIDLINIVSFESFFISFVVINGTLDHKEDPVDMHNTKNA